MACKELAQTIKRLRKAGTVVEVTTTGGNHLKLRLCNGTVYTCAKTPSDRRALLNMQSAIKRLTAA